ncbi:hypothetical protein H6503_02345 [Candidatus Woesearchaeota archaeon]|nr:hypothetical protein [Candidatus Woesearchaeota archaeon]
MKKIVYFYLKTGGGHISCARAISGYLDNKYKKNVKNLLVDGFTESPRYIRAYYEEGYKLSQSYAPWAYGAIYAINKYSKIVRFWSKINADRMMHKYVKKVIQKEKPDIIVNHHCVFIPAIEKVVEELDYKVPMFTVVSDPYTVHPFWVIGKKFHYIMFSDEARRAALNYGRSPDQISVFPFFLNEKFSKIMSQKDKIKTRAKYGFSKDKKIVLLLGGGDGVPKADKITKELLNSGLDIEIAVVCGKNDILKENVEKVSSGTNVKVYSFIDYVYDLVSIADIAIGKGGPSAVMETLLSQKIPIITSYVWEQEKGNVEFVVRNKLGFFEPDIKKVPLIVEKLLKNKKYYDSYKNRIKNLKLVNGTSQVADFIYNSKIK